MGNTESESSNKSKDFFRIVTFEINRTIYKGKRSLSYIECYQFKRNNLKNGKGVTPVPIALGTCGI